MMRVGIVGLGGISRVHIEGYDAIPNATLVAGADIQGAAAKNAAMITDRGLPIYTSMAEMLANEELDMVDICTPTDTHADLSVAAMEAGLHVLSEKPMARTSAEAEAILEAATRTGRRYMTAHVVRFMKPYAYLRQVIESGELGRPVHLMLRRLSPAPSWSYENWMLTPARSGGAPLDLSIHDLDFASSVFGKPKAVSAVWRPLPEGEGAALDHISASLLYDGFSVDVTGGFYYKEFPFGATYTAVFERGLVESTALGVVTKNGQPVEIGTEVRRESGINISSSSAYAEEIAYFVDCVEGGKPTERVLPESGLDTLRLIEDITKKAIKL